MMFHPHTLSALILLPLKVQAFSLVAPPPLPVAVKPLSTKETAPTVFTSGNGVKVEAPDLDNLFATICEASPAARKAISNYYGEPCDVDEDLPWKSVQSFQPHRTVQQIERLDNFQGRTAPLLRFRSNLPGPCLPDFFANFIMDVDERKRWDTQINDVQQIITLPTDEDPHIPGIGRRLGVGHCLTKAGLGISPREQLTLCGIQELPAEHGTEPTSYLIWGTELSPSQNHLLPSTRKRCTRATSHVFATTLTPRDPRSFDVEYILQLDIGGNLPTWLTTPIVTDSIRQMFRVAEDFFSGSDGRLLRQLEQQQREPMPDRLLLSTP